MNLAGLGRRGVEEGQRSRDRQKSFFADPTQLIGNIRVCALNLTPDPAIDPNI